MKQEEVQVNGTHLKGSEVQRARLPVELAVFQLGHVKEDNFTLHNWSVECVFVCVLVHSHENLSILESEMITVYLHSI